MSHNVRLSLFFTAVLCAIQVIFFAIIYTQVKQQVLLVGSVSQLSENLLAWFKTSFVISLLALTPFFFFATFWFSKLLLLPFLKVSEIAKSLSAERLSFRFPAPSHSSELKELIQTFNELLHRLEESFMRISHFASFVSHELRTPLSIINGEVGWLMKRERTQEELRASLLKVKSGSDQLKGITSRLLILMEVERLEPSQKENIFIEPFLRDLVSNAQTPEGKKKIVLSGQDTVVCFYPELMTSMVFNLIENAVKYSQSRVNVLYDVFDGKLDLIVEDDGPGVSQGDIPRLGEPFFRVHPEIRNGHGLGLAIVKACAQSCRGSVFFEQASLGGLSARLVLPV